MKRLMGQDMFFRYLPFKIFVETIEQSDAGVRKPEFIIMVLLPLSAGKCASQKGS